MSTEQFKGVVQAAIAQGLLPATARAPGQDNRPWPVVLLTALGAWLAALPLLGVVGLLFGDWLGRGGGTYLVGVLVLAGAIVVLRSREVPLFVEQLAVPALWVGGGAIGVGLFRDLHAQTGAGALALVAVGVAVAIRHAWLRVLLGAAAAVLMVIASLPEHWNEAHLPRFWWAWHLCLAVWVGAGWLQRSVFNDGARARAAATLESLSAGWLLATLAGLAAWSGMSFLVGGSLGRGLAGEVARELGRRESGGWSMPVLQALSLLLAVAAALWAARRWPTLRQPWHAGVAVVMAGLAWLMPALGAVLVVLAVCATSARWRLAGTAALAAAWIVGAFYYQLQWPLATKALLLIGAGALLGGLAGWAWRALGSGEPAWAAAPPVPATGASRLGIAVTALAVLAVANIGIWQKQDLIAHGQAVFVELAPADPRSLMQGDFMRLNFRVPADAQTRNGGLLRSERPRLVARRDARGVLGALRADTGAALAADELRVELTPKDGRWTLVTDAWFFREGEAQRWAAARYGEFRVAPDGRALLVGLRGPDLEAL